MKKADNCMAYLATAAEILLWQDYEVRHSGMEVARVAFIWDEH